MSQGICNDPRYEAGGFTPGSTDICHTETITLTNTGNVDNPKYYYNYQGESYDEILAKGVSTASLDYSGVTKSGIYKIIQVGKRNGKETVSCSPDIKVRVSNQPVFSYNFCLSPPTLQVIIPNHPLNDYTSYEISLNGNPPITANLGVTYPLPATGYNLLKVSGIGGSKTCSATNTPSIIRYDLFAGSQLDYYPKISNLTIEGASVKLNIVGMYGTDYNIKRYVSTSPYVTAAIVGNSKPGVHSDNAPDVNNTSYCYYIEPTAPQACGSYSLRSAELCTIPLKSVPPQTNLTKNTFAWAEYKWGNIRHPASLTPELNTPKLEVQKIEDGVLSAIPVNPVSEIIYSDQNLDCSKKYCYRIKVTTSGKISGVLFTGTSYSNEICADHKETNLASPTGAYVTTELDGINTISFNANNASPYAIKHWSIFKEDGGGNFTLLNELPYQAATPTIKDNTAVTKSETYKVSYTDECKNESTPTAAFSSVFLSQKGDVDLEWSPNSPFAAGNASSIEIVYLDAVNNSPIATVDAGTALNHKVDISKFNDMGAFRIKQTAADGHVSLSNRIEFPIKGHLYMPNAFSPNNDRKNDSFKPEGSVASVTDFKMEIFSKNGHKILEITDPNLGWNGMLPDNNRAPFGGYLYRFTATMKNGQIIHKNGSFTVIY